MSIPTLLASQLAQSTLPSLRSQTQIILPYIINPVVSLTHNCSTNIHMMGKQCISFAVYIYYMTSIV